MKTSSLLKVVTASTLVLASSVALAKECSEIDWKDNVLAEYPHIADACQGIVEMNGREYVELDAKYVRSAGSQVRMKFLHQDGEYGPTYETKNLPDNFMITIDGEKQSVHSLTRDSTMELFVPTDRFAIVASPAGAEPMEMAMAEEEQSSYSTLPSTASSTTLLALLGALACSLAAGLMVLRRTLRI